MTRQLVTIAPDATVEQAMEIFTTRRCRHLPVLSAGGARVGLIGDISRWLFDTHQAEAQQLRPYIAGGVPA